MYKQTYVKQVSEEALKKRHSQGWVEEVSTDLDDLICRIRQYRRQGRVTSIGFYGNVVDVW